MMLTRGDSPVAHKHHHSNRFGPQPIGTHSVHESGRWPGVELYYPPHQAHLARKPV